MVINAGIMLVERVYIIVYDLLRAFFFHPKESFTGNCRERGKNRDTNEKIKIFRIKLV